MAGGGGGVYFWETGGFWGGGEGMGDLWVVGVFARARCGGFGAVDLWAWRVYDHVDEWQL